MSGNHSLGRLLHLLTAGIGTSRTSGEVRVGSAKRGNSRHCQRPSTKPIYEYAPLGCLCGRPGYSLAPFPPNWRQGERRFPPPWSVDDPDAKLGQDCFIVRDANRRAIAYLPDGGAVVRYRGPQRTHRMSAFEGPSDCHHRVTGHPVSHQPYAWHFGN
jgi:hypothetical protein